MDQAIGRRRTATRRSPSARFTRRAAVALVAGGLVELVVHVLYGIGHGRTVINENKEVLGLTNDTWARVGVVGTAMLVVGLVVIRRTDARRVVRRATGMLLVGLVLRAAADWVFDLYVPAELLLLAGRGVLVAALLTGSIIGRWSAAPMALAVTAWIVFISFTDAVYDTSTDVFGMTVAGNDVLRFVTTVAWVCLGVALHRSTRRGDLGRLAAVVEDEPVRRSTSSSTQAPTGRASVQPAG